ncbi:MAG: response regulator transcription factor [Ignavibacteriales bacterium]|nr:response regulator transcription factor [Ignavibacteriales bacterium]
MKKILVVEDDPAILIGLEAALRDEHYEVITATDGEKCHRIVKQEKLDLIILDIMLPKKHGFEVCRDLRKEGFDTPILILTSKKEEVDKILGFELGADDYVTKPFSIRELQARIKALLRRKGEIKKDIEEFTFGSVHIDFKKQEAFKGEIRIKFSTKEMEVLKYLILREGEVVTREMLLEEVWGYDNFPTTRTVDNYILSLRKKIEDLPNEPKHLITVHTAGYKFIR